MARRRRSGGTVDALSEVSNQPLDSIDSLLSRTPDLELELARIRRLGEMEVARLAAAGPQQVFDRRVEREKWGPKEWQRTDLHRKHNLDWRDLHWGMQFYGPPLRGRMDKFMKSWYCAQRLKRQEVLFATGKTGKGSKQKVRRRNDRSDIRCR